MKSILSKSKKVGKIVAKITLDENDVVSANCSPIEIMHMILISLRNLYENDADMGKDLKALMKELAIHDFDLAEVSENTKSERVMGVINAYAEEFCGAKPKECICDNCKKKLEDVSKGCNTAKA